MMKGSAFNAINFGGEKVLGSFNLWGKIGILRVQNVTYDKVFGSGSSIDKFLVFWSFRAIFQNWLGRLYKVITNRIKKILHEFQNAA